MTVQDHRSVDLNGLVARVRALLLTPAAEWAKIEEEPATVGSLYSEFILILAAIAPICRAVGALVFGYDAWIVHVRPSVGATLSHAILSYIASLLIIFVLAMIIDALAPSFDGRKNRIQAFKIAAYSWTAAWLAGVFLLIPSLSGLAVVGLFVAVGLYSIYLLYLGLPRLMKTPEAKAPLYTLVTAVAAIVLYVVAWSITAPVIGLDMYASMGPANPGIGLASSSSGTIDLPNGERLDVGKLQSAANQIGNMARQFEQAANNPGSSSGVAVTAVSSEALKALLPESLPGGYMRTESESGAVLGTVHAEATYSSDGKTVTVSVTDLGAAGALATLASAFGIEADRESATGFDRVGRIDGVMTAQQYDRNAHSGKYGVLLDDRFIISAEGSVRSFDDLKSAVAAVGPDRVLKLR